MTLEAQKAHNKCLRNTASPKGKYLDLSGGSVELDGLSSNLCPMDSITIMLSDMDG